MVEAEGAETAGDEDGAVGGWEGPGVGGLTLGSRGDRRSEGSGRVGVPCPEFCWSGCPRGAGPPQLSRRRPGLRCGPLSVLCPLELLDAE